MKVDRMFFEKFEDQLKAYATDHKLRDIIETKRLTDLNVYPAFGMSDFKDVPTAWRTRIPEYIKDYVPLNQFM